MSLPLKLLSKKRSLRYATEHIPYRVVQLDMGMFACMIIRRGLLNQKGDLSVSSAFTFKDTGYRLFTNMALDVGLLYCRVLLNFLGIYKSQSAPRLVSRRPHERFAESEVWIERFRGGRLLTVKEVCQPLHGKHTSQKMYYHIVRTLDAASRSAAHLTVPKIAKSSIDALRVDSLYLTCSAAKHHVLEHFYRRTLHQKPPKMLTDFEKQTDIHLTDA